MNNIHAKDWAEESWGGFTGMDCTDEFCIIDNNSDEKPDSTADEDSIPPSGEPG